MRLRFYSTADLVNVLEQEKSQGRAGRIAMSLVRMNLVVLDELGYETGAQRLQHVLDHRRTKRQEHGHGSAHQPPAMEFKRALRSAGDSFSNSLITCWRVLPGPTSGTGIG